MDVLFVYDFASPNAYLAHATIPDLEKRHEARFVYYPALLGGIFKSTNNRAPMEAFAGIDNKLNYLQLETKRFIERHRITKFQRNPYFPVNTLQIMRGAVYAHSQDFANEYIETLFKNMWEEPKKLDDLDVFRGALQESGLPADQILTACQQPEIKQKLIDNTSTVVEKGVFGIPSFFVDEELFFGKDSLRDVEERLTHA